MQTLKILLRLLDYYLYLFVSNTGAKLNKIICLAHAIYARRIANSENGVLLFA